ncbi:peptide chain release factor N(5)-glutamine methyltransferase [Pediococcus pentosaceus]|nr:peptide chain release factor N(5)-glutamine methyltransferase [Pediococcus pentosaceus]MBF7129505.1 peptide chain release factor N(5)-glutamine methyltransferase [Pediococcus pentosaceus]MBF7133034.1 peptide chain release factor N(5)-glutamine methyltransferase [Pediococcus pentosaceus]
MNNIPTYFEALRWASLFIRKNQGDENAPELILMDTMEWSRTELIMHYREKLFPEQWEKFQTAVKRVAKGEPVQYVTNKATFFGREFYVDKRVLIPRVETEELVETILSKTKRSRQRLRVLDIGTGSGDIAITLKLERPEWLVTAVDISKDALTVAQRNAESHEAIVDFRLGSLFEPVQGERFDLIISNPPYIADNEKHEMDQSVIDFEPHQALFADDHGLFCYKRIADQLDQYLVEHGELGCEIGYRQGTDLKKYFLEKKYIDQAEVIKDLSQHDRILWVKKK